MTWNCAHRGASAHAPENTLAALRLAVDQGAGMAEMDVQLSADGVPVLIHDETLDRTTDGQGPVAALPAAEIQRLDAGSWFGPDFAVLRSRGVMMNIPKMVRELHSEIIGGGQIPVLMSAERAMGGGGITPGELELGTQIQVTFAVQ